MAFRVGQKVVCVDAGISRFSGCLTNVKVGHKYTIHHYAVNEEGYPFVLLKEVVPPLYHCGYDIRRFAPCIERKTDISIFTEMLNPKQREQV